MAGEMSMRSTSTIGCTQGTCKQNTGLSGKDICNIIRACAKAKVSEFTLGEVKVVFGEAKASSSPWLGLAAPSSQVLNQTPFHNSIGGQEPIDELELSAADKMAMDELVEAHMLIESPLEYEDSIINSSLADEHLRDAENANEDT